MVDDSAKGDLPGAPGRGVSEVPEGEWCGDVSQLNLGMGFLLYKEEECLLAKDEHRVVPTK